VDPDDVAAILSKAPLLASVPRPALFALARRSPVIELSRGESLFREGDAANDLYVVVDGTVKVSVASQTGAEMVLTTLGRGDAVGELALFDDAPRSATVSAVAKSALVSIDRSSMIAILVEYPGAVDGLLRGIAGALRRLTEQAADLVFLDLDGRVAKLLGQAARRAGGGSADPIELDLHLTQRELADIVGGSRQSVNQILKAFERRGLLEVRGTTIAVFDVAALERRATGRER
jgi:CRP/FNR family cyclic AMP-dependent transcriptional regulator